ALADIRLRKQPLVLLREVLTIFSRAEVHRNILLAAGKRDDGAIALPPALIFVMIRPIPDHAPRLQIGNRAGDQLVDRTNLGAARLLQSPQLISHACHYFSPLRFSVGAFRWLSVAAAFFSSAFFCSRSLGCIMPSISFFSFASLASTT